MPTNADRIMTGIADYDASTLDLSAAAKEDFGAAVDQITNGAALLADAAVWGCVPGWFATEINEAVEQIRAIRDRLDRLAGGEYGAYRWRR